MARTAVLIAFSVGILLSCLQVYWDYLQEGDELSRSVEEIMLVHSKSSSRVVMILDPELAEEMVEGLVIYPFIREARIIDENNEILASYRDVSTDQELSKNSTTLRIARSFVTDMITFSRDLEVENTFSDKPGRLEVVVDKALGMQPFFSRVMTIFLSGFIRNFLLVGLLYFVFYASLTKPLSQMVGQVSLIDPEQPGERRIPIAENHREDEIGILAQSLNNAFDKSQAMLDNMRATNKALASSEDTLRKRTWELEKEVQNGRKITMELIATKEEAEKANRAKSAFLANVSHELRTPLNAIIGFSSIMSDEMFGPIGNDRYKSYLNDIKDSSEHLGALLGEVLDLAKIEAGQMQMEPEDFAFTDLLNESVSLMSGQAASKSLKLTSKIPNDLPLLHGDRLRIKQSVINILSNAIKFTPESGKVHLEAHIREDGGCSVYVEDTGIGIPSEEHEDIFTPFMRASGALSRSHEGTGLGLAIVASFVNEHEGTIELDSEMGEGTKITINFPAERSISSS
ncbi:ATP-binding protein [Temperatibacter marinus]|uniref:histidine kinase n=1 Tax=Temperatibacter marinus TaxID=1456591 RepID=A0AA52EIN9_9PROT|nr:ATP-binding protein [Temperatibacter marinus]WND02756.1 ATP-binding protein [Temperatibacter marinus]